MSYRKIADLAVKTGTYTGADGRDKGRYENVGHVLQDDSGAKLYCLKRTFSPAGVPNPDNRDTVILSVFEPREAEPPRASRPMESYPSTPPRPARETASAGADPYNDDIPF